MTELPEERQAAALRRVAELGRRRAQLRKELDAITAEIQPAVLDAVEKGAVVSRVIELSNVARVTVYGWIRASAKQEPDE